MERTQKSALSRTQYQPLPTLTLSPLAVFAETENKRLKVPQKQYNILNSDFSVTVEYLKHSSFIIYWTFLIKLFQQYNRSNMGLKLMRVPSHKDIGLQWYSCHPFPSCPKQKQLIQYAPKIALILQGNPNWPGEEKGNLFLTSLSILLHTLMPDFV